MLKTLYIIRKCLYARDVYGSYRMISDSLPNEDCVLYPSHDLPKPLPKAEKSVIFYYISSILCNVSLADETVQDCMLKLANSITELPNIPSESAKALIISMVKNKARNNSKIKSNIFSLVASFIIHFLQSIF